MTERKYYREIQPEVFLINETNNKYGEIVAKIEQAGRNCYNSKSKDFESALKFIRMIIKRGHESVLEHHSFTFKIVTDRAIANELVRHRIASFSQLSTRYFKFNDAIPVIMPIEIKKSDEDEKRELWDLAMDVAGKTYNSMLKIGIKPENARSVLPQCTATTLYMTMNIRELRHFLKLRTAKASHPDMRRVANMILKIMKENYSVFFEDIELGE
ncbi:FAD-dependent thymidylate synthase [Peptoniphilus sp. MSJ-1]|uniref:Flavin-dependent thymidylate synthase n=1 Tax=Peptoniphilus ovalis TaxID=2841503 RepID=A0ABS6FHG0_9FIRM|nr:FAD-dependent thymidylate synthase [Peptoniphilus ovalis]MBU5669606.1 FAD-dependent thymidylate synthase [Peptoniphilus ovalis]